MKKNLIRAKTRDVAYNFRMGAGFPGDVNRTHPASIEPVLIDTTNPPLAYGHLVMIATSQGVRKVIAGDQSDATAIGYGILVRPYPIQQSSASNFGQADFGAAVPAARGTADVLRSGYIMTKLPVGQNPKKGDPVYVWATANSGAHIQSGFEATASAGNTNPVKNATFNGTPDADGNVEICFNV